MAPVEQYLMGRDAEIALARSAAPDAISHDASVIVLTRHGYEALAWAKKGAIACDVAGEVRELLFFPAPEDATK